MSHPAERILGDSAAIRALRDQIRGLVAPEVAAVLLLGETGTGKGLVARVIHDAGARATRPFVDVNCAAIPETLLEAELFGYEADAVADARRPKPGLFEVASGGTLFLDELDALSLPLQGKLLHAIEEKRIRRLGASEELSVAVTLVAATRVDVPAAVAAGRFRADLYRRLALALVSLPPLRTREDDVLLLAREFLGRHAEGHGLVTQRFDPTAEEWLRRHPWPGNVRELEHLMERVTLLHKDRVITREALEAVYLPQAATAAGVAEGPGGLRGHLDVGEADRVRAVLARTSGNVARAARLLEMSRGALRHRMTRLGIVPPRLDEAKTASAERPAAKRRSRAADIRRKDWARKAVVVLAVEVTWPPSDGDRLLYEPLTAASRLEKTVEQKARGFGGLVVQRSASLVVIVFGAPRTLDQLPQRALQAAFAIRQEIAQSAATAHGTVGPRVRQGLHWGELLVTTETRDGLVDFRPVDDVLAQPVRLLGHSASGEILVTPALVPYVERWCELEPRGIGGPHVVLDAKLRRASFAGHGSRPLSRFVGRDREVATLEELLQHAGQWHGQVVTITGAPGVGKSRLIREVVNGPQCDGWLVVHAAGVSHGKAVPYLPIADLLRSYFEIDALDGPSAIVTQATERVLALDEALEPVLPALLTLLDAPAGDAKGPARDAARQRQHTADALQRLVLRECQVRPVLIVIEDLHWSDAETLAVLDALVDSLPAARVLLLVTARPEWRHGWWAGKAHFTLVRLDPLGPESSRQLVREWLGDDATIEAVEPAVLERAAGNPFFIEEIVQSLADAGTLTGGRGRYQLARRPETLGIAPTVQAVLAARIDRLSREDRDVLLAAAIVGMQVPRVLLREVTELDDDALQTRVARLLAAEFLYESAFFPEVVYTFKHALTHEVAYSAVPRERRRAGHTCVAERLVQLSGDRLAERTELIAHHAVRAEQWETAVVWLRHAGVRAVARGALPEATARFEHALRVVDHLSAGADRDELGIDLRLDLQGVLNPQGRFDELTKHLAEAEAIADALGDRRRLARVAGGLTHTHWWRGELDRAIDVGARAVEIATALGDRDAEVVTRDRLGVAYVSAGRFRLAVPHYRRIITALRGAPVTERCGLRALPAITSRAWLALALAHLGEFEEATALGAEALRLADDAGHAFTRAKALLAVGTVFAVRGHLAEAVARLERALGVMEANDIAALIPLTTHRLASATARAGRVGDALALLERGLPGDEHGRPPMQEAVRRLANSEVSLAAGRLDEAFRAAEHALVESRAYGMRADEMQALLALAGIHAARGSAFDQATATYAAALDLADTLGARPFAAQAQLGLGKLYRRAGDRSLARRHLGTALVMLREMDMWRWLEETEQELAAPAS